MGTNPNEKHTKEHHAEIDALIKKHVAPMLMEAVDSKLCAGCVWKQLVSTAFINLIANSNVETNGDILRVAQLVGLEAIMRLEDGAYEVSEHVPKSKMV